MMVSSRLQLESQIDTGPKEQDVENAPQIDESARAGICLVLIVDTNVNEK